ncbi:MAG TPA: hypothetical protein VHB25_08840 [Gemmatimonadaceae bacterium]|nr:hypothetical protein [Gemmatimonadaceae bacterium]
MRTRLALLAALVALPSTTLAAQRGGSRGDHSHTDLFQPQEMPSGPKLRDRDIQDLSDLKLLIDKHKDLQLTDDQVKTLEALENKEKDSTAQYFQLVDSLVHELRPPLNPSDADRNRMRATVLALRNVIRTIRETYAGDANAAIAQYTPEQQQKAKELMDKLREDGDKRIQERLGRGDRRDGGN